MQDPVDPKQVAVLMWGYLPAAAPKRTPLQHPMPVPPPADELNWKAICSGGCGFALSISESGKLNTWGSTEDTGQSYLTSGKHKDRPEPFPIPTSSPIVQAAAGWSHCAVVTDKGEVYTWGWKECVPAATKPTADPASASHMATERDPSETTGSEEHTDQMDYSDSQPTPSSGLKSKTSFPADRVRGGLPSPTGKVQAGKALKVLNTGSVTGESEKIGDEGSRKRRLSVDQATSSESSTIGSEEAPCAPPCLVIFHPGVKIVSVAAGGRHSLALSDIYQVWGWGYGGEGQLGLGTRLRTVSYPHPIPCLDTVAAPYWQELHLKGGKALEGSLSSKVPGSYVKAIACGGRHSAILTDAGAVLTFGWGLYGQCGQGSTDDELSPCYVSSLGGLPVKAVATGLWHTVCVTESGDVYSFGGNQFGQLGTGGDQAETYPRLLEDPILENQHATTVSCGARHTAICTDGGKVFCWGWNKYGQLGIDDTADRSIPAEVPLEGLFATDVACGWWHTLALAVQCTS